MAHAFIWYELMTPDPAAAARFYGPLVGWETRDWPSPDGSMPYTLVGRGEAMVAGIMGLPEPMLKNGAPPHWAGYVHVENVEDACAKATSLGGMVCVPPGDIPEVGRFAVIADPQGATLNIMTPLPREAPPASLPLGSSGRCGWHELLTSDQDAALAFYNALFGWTKVHGHDMGAMGTYDIFAINGCDSGGIFTKPPQANHAFWMFYFTVDDIQAAAKAVAAGGGTVLMGPHEVPGGSWILNGRDPQGVYFALVKPNMG